MAAERATFEEVLALAQALPREEQARLLARLAPTTTVEEAAQTIASEPAAIARLPMDTPAGALARDPGSALGRLIRLISDEQMHSQEDVRPWREERLSARYGG